MDCNLREKNKLEQISKLMDKINKKEGKNIVSLGVARNKDEQAEAIAFSSIWNWGMPKLQIPIALEKL